MLLRFFNGADEGRAERREALKDLTDMANGGGGTILYGIDETSGDDPVAGDITAIADLTLTGKLEDIVRDGVRPPLLMELRVIEVGDGVVLVADVEPSPLGPYMVEGYGENRYYHRSGSQTRPMSEQQVRDSYVLAARDREHRAETWASHVLPMPVLSTDPWLTVSALPEEPLREVLDLATVSQEALQPPDPLRRHIAESIGTAVQRLSRWADGYFGADADSRQDSAYQLVRLHRDGAGGVASRLQSDLSPLHVARDVNGVLAYFAWIWTHFDQRRPIEIEITLHNLMNVTLFLGTLHGQRLAVREPHGVPSTLSPSGNSDLVSDIVRASGRHRIVKRFADRLYQAFGRAECEPMFHSGQLYGRDGVPISLSLAGSGLWSPGHRTASALIYDDQTVRHTRADTEVIGHFIEGTIIDSSGDTLAVLELATGRACPSDFLPTRLAEDPRAAVPGGDPGRPHEARVVHRSAAATGRWSGDDLRQLIAP